MPIIASVAAPWGISCIFSTPWHTELEGLGAYPRINAWKSSFCPERSRVHRVLPKRDCVTAGTFDFVLFIEAGGLHPQRPTWPTSLFSAVPCWTQRTSSHSQMGNIAVHGYSFQSFLLGRGLKDNGALLHFTSKCEALRVNLRGQSFSSFHYLCQTGHLGKTP